MDMILCTIVVLKWGWGIINVLPYGRNWLHQGCIIAAGKDVIINRRGRRYSW